MCCKKASKVIEKLMKIIHWQSFVYVLSVESDMLPLIYSYCLI